MDNKDNFLTDVERRLAESELGVFSTVGANGAKSRTVDYIAFDKKIAFFSWANSAKIEEIAGNPETGFCVNEVQMEGLAEVKELGDPGLEGFMKYYQTKFPELFAKFTTLPDIVFIILNPNRVKRMSAEGPALYIESFDYKTNELKKEKFSDW